MAFVRACFRTFFSLRKASCLVLVLLGVVLGYAFLGHLTSSSWSPSQVNISRISHVSHVSHVFSATAHARKIDERLGHGTSQTFKKETILKAILQDKDAQDPTWGETVQGVRTRFVPHGKELALTLDACGSHSDGYDEKLMRYLMKKRIPATLFINQRWIQKHPKPFKALAANPLFSIQNHGTVHRPCSIYPRRIYGIESTKNASECYDEIQHNAETISSLTHKRPLFYRSGTAYYDTAGVRIAQALRHEVIGFSILGDRGASYSKEEVYDALKESTSGDIIIAHMNHPESETAEGLLKVIPQLLKAGYRFTHLEGKILQ
jgi:peptidoglycan/xylan/chitin deacetylase (PgdA/CDA1 family)